MHSAICLLLIAASVVAGLYCCMLGIAALKHMHESTESDRTYGWTLWWFLEASRYNDTGKKMCRQGAIVFFSGIALVILGWSCLV